MNSEKLKPNPSLMTKTTLIRLTQELEKAELDLAKSKVRIGEAAGDSHDWHDNFAFEGPYMLGVINQK